MTYLLSIGIMVLCFLALGIGILFFGRKDIGGDCRKAPEDRKDGCLSKKVGICPMEDKDGYLKLATMTSRLKSIIKKDKK